MSYLQAIVVAFIQGVTELFPVSSLGHSVLVPAWLGGSWQTLVDQSATAHSKSSFYLAYIVALHVATALALLWFFRRDWVRIIAGFFRSAARSVKERRLSIADTDERLAWLIVIATIPVGLTGLAFEHAFRTLFAKPLAAAVFLLLNGVLLIAGERLRRRSAVPSAGGALAADATDADPVAGRTGDAATVLASRTATANRAAVGQGAAIGQGAAADQQAEDLASDARISGLSFRDAVIVGCFQILALFAGISRSGSSMVGGLLRGLGHEDAARFAFLLATPVIFAAGVLKLPSLAGPAAAGIHGQIVVGMLVAGVAAYLSVRFLVRYFQTRTLTPFAIYCLLAGAASILRFAIG